MREITFKIRIDELEMLDWEQWGTDDQEYILKCAKVNRVEVIHRNKDIIFKGSFQGMYWMLQDIANRYDVKLI